MADIPTPPDDTDPQAVFLDALWDELDAAHEIAVSARVMDRLDDVITRCEAAITLIRRWQDQPSAP